MSPPTKLFLPVFTLALAVSACFWGAVIWFSFLQFLSMKSIEDGMIIAVAMGLLASMFHSNRIVDIEMAEYGIEVDPEKLPHSFEIFELLMFRFCVGWVGVLYDMFMLTIMAIRKFFHQAGETWDHLMGY